MTLSSRLLTALSFVPKDAVVFDVGSDRGAFLLALEEKKIPCYGGENKKGPYEGLKRNLADNGSKVPVFLQDGISFLPEDVTFVTILGMGGMTIRGILERGKENLKKVKGLLVSPQSCCEEVTGLLEELGYENVDGCYVYERHYYPILLYRKAGNKTKPLDRMERKYGPYPVRTADPLLEESLLKREKSLASLPKEAQKKNEVVREEIDQLLERLEKARMKETKERR